MPFVFLFVSFFFSCFTGPYGFLPIDEKRTKMREGDPDGGMHGGKGHGGAWLMKKGGLRWDTFGQKL